MNSKQWKISAPLLPHAGRRAILIPYRQLAELPETLSSDHWPLPDDLPEIERLLDSNHLEGATAQNIWRRITRAGPTRQNKFGWTIPVKTELPKIHGWLNAHNYRDHYRVRP